MASRKVSQGDNIIRNPTPIASALTQAQAFLNYFCQQECVHLIPTDLSDGDPELDDPFSFPELKAALGNIRPTTPGADGISVKLLQLFSEKHQKKLLEIFNEYLTLASFLHAGSLLSYFPFASPVSRLI